MDNMEKKIRQWAEERAVPKRSDGDIRQIVQRVTDIDKATPQPRHRLRVMALIATAAAVILVAILLRPNLTPETPVVPTKAEQVVTIKTMPCEVDQYPVAGSDSTSLVQLDQYAGLFAMPEETEMSQ